MTIAQNIETIQQIIAETAAHCHRSPNDIQLLAVSKGQSIEAIREAFKAGITNFGENYYQEAQFKIDSLTNLAINWHFIGPIQSNKVENIAKQFSWVHSVSREKIAKLCSLHRDCEKPPLNLCIQINLDNEVNKAGVAPQQALQLALFIRQLPNVRLRGLMAIPKPHSNEKDQLDSFLRLTDLFNQLNKELDFSMDTLSMGMSNDLVAAVQAGSTIVRVGQAIFGERRKQ